LKRVCVELLRLATMMSKKSTRSSASVHKGA
jgi:hypothetical protein